MITLIILLVLLVIGILILKYCDYVFAWIGYILTIPSILMLLFHLCIWPFISYNYEIIESEKIAIQKTIDTSRQFDNPLENAAITNKIIEFNTNLAYEKYKNKTLFFDQYIDDRIETLDYIY